MKEKVKIRKPRLPGFSYFKPDPLAEKYYSISPYVYCANNPVRYLDPDGKVIVDANGKAITYNQKTGWSSNVTHDVQRMGNAMLKSGTASRQLFGMMDNTAKISITISDKVVKGRDGGYIR